MSDESTVTTRRLITELVAAFGDADRVVANLALDAQWWISPTVGVLASPTVGRDAILTGMKTTFEQLYADPRTVVHHTLADGDVAATRFTMYATALFADGKPYENEYSLWIQAAEGKIVRVWEYLDVAHAAGQFGLVPPSD